LTILPLDSGVVGGNGRSKSNWYIKERADELCRREKIKKGVT